MKDTLYFKHDLNMDNDPKMIKLIGRMGQEGKGIYCSILERLYQQPGFTYQLDLIPDLARVFNTAEDKVKRIISDEFGLFTVKDGVFYSKSALDRGKEFELKKELWRKAGLRSAEVRALNHPATTLQPPSNTPVQQVKVSKVNISKDKYGELQNVLLSKEEYGKLIDKFGEPAKEKIRNLDTYIGSHGDKYKSHYATILNWARDDDPQTKNEVDNW